MVPRVYLLYYVHKYIYYVNTLCMDMCIIALNKNVYPWSRKKGTQLTVLVI